MKTIFLVVLMFVLTIAIRTHIRVLLITSDSMYPRIEAGDMVISTHKRSYDIHDIVTYKAHGNTLVTHRIVSIKEDKLITKGDANNTLDKPISFNDIQGKVIFILKMPQFIRRI